MLLQYAVVLASLTTAIEFNIVTYNIQNMPGLSGVIYPTTTGRIDRIPQSDIVKDRHNTALFIFNEAFQTTASTTTDLSEMLTTLETTTPFQQVGQASIPQGGAIFNSGVFPLVNKTLGSRITSHSVQYYNDCCGTDCLASKGFYFVEMQYTAEITIGVVGTHLQAEDDACSSGEDKEIRTKQLAQINAFLDTNTSADVIILIGDLNIKRSETKELNTMLTTIFKVPSNTKLTYTDNNWYSVDPERNSYAKAINATTEYLDYGIVLRCPADKSCAAVNKGLEGIMPDNNTIQFQGNTINYFSDHDPVEVTIAIEQALTSANDSIKSSFYL